MKIELARYNINSINYSDRGYQNVYQNGEDNRFPDYLDALFNSSVTHQSIVNDLVDYIYGQGLRASNPASQEKLDKFFYKKRTKTIIRNKLLQNQVCIEVIKSKSGEIAKLELLAPKQIRVSAIHRGKPEKFVYRTSWDSRKYQQYKDVAYLDRITPDRYSGLYYWYDSGTFEVPYGRPKYISGLNPIELEAAIYLMHNHGAQNGMFPSMLVDMVTSGDPEKDQEALANVVNQMAGAANAGKIGAIFRPAGDGNQTNFITPNLTGLDKIYENQYQTAEIGILKAWQIPSPTLISGLNTKSSGFSNPAEEMEFALKILQEKRVEPEREEIIEILQPLFDGLGIGEVEFVGEEISIEEEGEQAASRFAEFGVGGVNGIIEIQRAIAEGTSTLDGGISTLQFVYGFDRDSAAKILGGESESVLKPNATPESEQDLEADRNDTIRDLTGRQFQGIERIVRKFKKGQLDYGQASMLLKSGFGIREEEVSTWLGNNDVELSAETTELDKFIEAGETMEDFIGWTVDSIMEVDYELEDELDKHVDRLNGVKLTSTGTARPNQKSSQDGSNRDVEYKVRYRYTGDPVTPDTRTFCKDMLNANKLYRKEDINNMSFSSVNPGFGKGGANNYNIFFYKGGVNCHHKWERITFVKDKDLKGDIDTKSAVAERDALSESEADARGMNPKNNPLVATKPIDMPNKGRYTLSGAIKSIKEWL